MFYESQRYTLSLKRPSQYSLINFYSRQNGLKIIAIIFMFIFVVVKNRFKNSNLKKKLYSHIYVYSNNIHNIEIPQNIYKKQGFSTVRVLSVCTVHP